METNAYEIVTDTSVSDRELTSLLERVYVDGGHTPVALAATLFAADAVRARGSLLSALDTASRALLGTLIVVGPDEATHALLDAREAELQLLAVLPSARGRGIGKALVEAGLRLAHERGCDRVVLSTQPSMRSARAIYLACGFVRIPERDWTRMGRSFLVYGHGLQT